jgi:hypothetical protein
MPAFDDFISSIKSSALRRITRYWVDAGDSKRLPAWSDLRPAPIKSDLPIVWSYKYDAANRSFTGRLAGEQIERLFGRNFRGLPLTEMHPTDRLPWVYDLCSRVVTEPAAFYGSGNICKQGEKFGAGERILLPLSTDGVLSDGILGATEYDLKFINSDRPFEPMNDREHWFSLAVR